METDALERGLELRSDSITKAMVTLTKEVRSTSEAENQRKIILKAEGIVTAGLCYFGRYIGATLLRKMWDDQNPKSELHIRQETTMLDARQYLNLEVMAIMFKPFVEECESKLLPISHFKACLETIANLENLALENLKTKWYKKRCSIMKLYPKIPASTYCPVIGNDKEEIEKLQSRTENILETEHVAMVLQIAQRYAFAHGFRHTHRFGPDNYLLNDANQHVLLNAVLRKFENEYPSLENECENKGIVENVNEYIDMLQNLGVDTANTLHLNCRSTGNGDSFFDAEEFYPQLARPIAESTPQRLKKRRKMAKRTKVKVVKSAKVNPPKDPVTWVKDHFMSILQWITTLTFDHDTLRLLQKEYRGLMYDTCSELHKHLHTIQEFIVRGV